MELRPLALSVAAGVSAFLVVGVAVTENASAAIEFSVFLGIPAGTVAGIAAAAFVYRRLGATDPTTRRVALAGGGFGVAFLAAAAVGVAAGVPHSVTFPVATAAALLGAAVTYTVGGEP